MTILSRKDSDSNLNGNDANKIDVADDACTGGAQRGGTQCWRRQEKVAVGEVFAEAVDSSPSPCQALQPTCQQLPRCWDHPVWKYVQVMRRLSFKISPTETSHVEEGAIGGPQNLTDLIVSAGHGPH